MPVGKKILPALISIVLFVTLLNNTKFESPTMAAYFLFVLSTAILMLLTSLAYLFSKATVKQHNTLPVILLVVLTLYYFLHTALQQQGIGIMHVLLLAYCLLFVCCVILLNIFEVNLRHIYTGITALAAFESVICLLQLSGVVNSPTTLFRVSGTWVNPNVTAMFLAMSTPAVLILSLQAGSFKRKIYLFVLLLISVALLSLKCRTAFIGVLINASVIANAKFQLIRTIRERFKTTKAVVIYTLFICVAAALLTGLYYSKQASADGRKLIWKVSLQMVAERPLTGVGYGYFEREYNLKQAAWLNSNKASATEINNADYVQMAYNEYLQHLVEGGVVAFIIVILFFISLLWLSPPRNNLPAVAAHAAIASLIGMSVFNFSFQAIPAMCLFMIYAAVVVTVSEPKIKFILFWYRMPVCGLLLLLGVYMLYSQGTTATASLKSRRAGVMTMMGKANMAIKTLAPLENSLAASEIYWVNYGTALQKQKSYTAALEKFRRATMLKSHPATYLKMALCYQKLNKKDSAINACLLAQRIAPNRIAPLFSMMIIYADERDTENAREMASQVIAKTPRVPSKEASYYKHIAAKILKNINHTNDIQ